MESSGAKFWLKLLLHFLDEDLYHYASSLSFHTILSLIPILLISFWAFLHLSIFDFSQYYDLLMGFLYGMLLPGHQEVVSKYIGSFLENSGQIGLLGLGFIIFTSTMFFLDFEYIINKLLNSKPSSFLKSFTSYFLLITIAPIGIAFSFYLSGLIQDFLDLLKLDWINFLFIFPYLVIWSLFFTSYLVASNKKISFKNGAIASFLASLVWYVSKAIFVYYIFYNKTYTTIYGSFGIVFFFFIWIYFSWIVFLFGVKICYILETIGARGQKWEEVESKIS